MDSEHPENGQKDGCEPLEVEDSRDQEALNPHFGQTPPPSPS
jgi:hypothetical protein